ncbi:hypothetical protein NDU88_003453 [Pleurodeles waltl]|uniref:Uncharacterized protein n=1 Tax=Pleurodeles waltl TaxID=8319 RepID=A0AAV7SDH5_PLEWA|nr:hypothetical protein NDU88_003453 [Pleurodeles waltl]
MCADIGKEKTFQTRSSGAARILCFLRCLFHWLHCCGVHTCWRASVRRMPPKGVKAVPSAGRGKPLRVSTTTRQGVANEKHPVDLMNNRLADMALPQLEIVQQRSPSSDGGSLAENLVNQGNVDAVNDGKMEAVCLATSRDREVVQSDKFFSLSDHSSWSSNEHSDFEADKNSPEPDSEISCLASDRELLESGKSATVRKKQRKRSEHSGSVKHLLKPQDTKGLQWDYSKGDLTLHGNTEKQYNPVSLETIYQSIMEHREESRESQNSTSLS